MSGKKKINVVNFIIKTILLFLLLYVIYRQLFVDNDAALMMDELIVSVKNSNPLLLVSAVLLLALNLLFEALKWETLVSVFTKISVAVAVKAVLTGVAAGIITPARFGEYFGRILVLKPEHNWKGAWATFVASIAQNLVTFFFGILGLALLPPDFLNGTLSGISSFLLPAGGVVFLLLLYFYYHIDLALKIISKLGFAKIVKKIKPRDAQEETVKDKKILNKVLILSFLRYFVFSLQYYLILRFFGVQGQGIELFAAIFTIFLIQTAIPLPGILDVFSKSEIAILVLSHFSTNKIMILSSALSLWIVNLLIPALLGMILISGIDIAKSYGYD